MNPQINTIDFNERPFIAIWEVTQACDLACVHCRASAHPRFTFCKVLENVFAIK